MQKIGQQLESNVGLVYALMDFDRVLMDFCIHQVQSLHDRFKKQDLTRAIQSTENSLSVLTNVRKNDSLRQKYETIFNQCVVLLVSYFATALEDAFKHCLRKALERDTPDPVSAEEIKITLAELKDCDYDLSDKIADLVASKEDISFQDMKSVNRTFKHYFGYNHERDNTLNNIIFGQASRHIIVHAGGRITDRFLRQIQSITPRDVKQSLSSNTAIQFSPEEIRVIGNSMLVYFERMVTALQPYA